MVSVRNTLDAVQQSTFARARSGVGRIGSSPSTQACRQVPVAPASSTAARCRSSQGGLSRVRQRLTPPKEKQSRAGCCCARNGPPQTSPRSSSFHPHPSILLAGLNPWHAHPSRLRPGLLLPTGCWQTSPSSTRPGAGTSLLTTARSPRGSRTFQDVSSSRLERGSRTTRGRRIAVRARRRLWARQRAPQSERWVCDAGSPAGECSPERVRPVARLLKPVATPTLDTAGPLTAGALNETLRTPSSGPSGRLQALDRLVRRCLDVRAAKVVSARARRRASGWPAQRCAAGRCRGSAVGAVARS